MKNPSAISEVYCFTVPIVCENIIYKIDLKVPSTRFIAFDFVAFAGLEHG